MIKDPFDEEEARFYIKVDKDNLDEEWERLPTFVYDYSLALAKATKERDQAEDQLDLQFSEIQGDIESNPSDYDLKRVTDVSIKQCVIRTPEYQDKLKTFREKQAIVNTLWAAIRALGVKQQAVDWCGKLFLRNYYAESTLDDKTKQRYGVEKTTRDLTEDLNKRRRIKNGNQEQKES